MEDREEALTKGGDPDKFVNQFMNVGGPLKITALKNMFLEGTKNLNFLTPPLISFLIRSHP